MRLRLFCSHCLFLLLLSRFLVLRKYLGAIHVAFIVFVEENLLQVLLFEDRLKFSPDLCRDLLLTGLGIRAFLLWHGSSHKNFIGGPKLTRRVEPFSFCSSCQIVLGLQLRRFDCQCLPFLVTAVWL